MTDSPRPISGEELAEQAWSLLIDSVRLRLRSDVPSGVFLSGGLDSSLVTAAAAQVSSQPIKTFTIGVPGSPLDETHHARLIADAFNTEHHVLPIEAPSLDLLDELAPFIDEPIADSSILPTFLVSRMTRQHVTVALADLYSYMTQLTPTDFRYPVSSPPSGDRYHGGISLRMSPSSFGR